MKKTLRVLFFTVIIIVIVVILKSYIITHTKKNSANRIYSETNLISTTSSDDVYDVILFWGQSNMLGACGYFGAERLYERFKICWR